MDSGQYYRLTIDCPDVRDDLTGWRIEMPEFLNNAHLRLVTVGDIEVHLQGLSFNAIECDEIGISTRELRADQARCLSTLRWQRAACSRSTDR